MMTALETQKGIFAIYEYLLHIFHSNKTCRSK